MPPAPQADELRFEISTPATITPASLATSPDGRWVVFAAASKGREELWLRSLNNPALRVLPGAQDAQYPFWSPDSTSIGFFADAQLKRIDVESGAVRTVAPAGVMLGGAWNHDDTILFTPGASAPVYRVPAAGGSATPVTATNAEAQNHRFPRVLPDGRHFLHHATGTAPGIYIGKVDDPQGSRLLEAEAAVFAGPQHLLFVREGVLYAQAFDPERLALIRQPTTWQSAGDNAKAVRGVGRWAAVSRRRTGRGHAADHRGPQLEASSLT
jgi:hypothetical protein